MNVRVLLIVPVALAVGVLAGCGGTGGDSGAGKGSGLTQVRMPSTEICRAPAYILEHAPEGLCTGETDDELHGNR